MAVDKLVDSTVLDGYFENIADAIRGKNGSSDTYTPSEMPAAITAIPSGGGDSLYGVYTDDSYEYENLTATSIPTYMCYNSKVKSLNLPEVLTIGNYAFNGCNNMTTLTLPKATTIGQFSFYSCRNLETINLPNVTSIDQRGFAGTTSSLLATVHRSISIPECTSLANYALQYSPLTTIYWPKIETIGSSCFEGCTNLTSITIPASFTGTVNGGVFNGCSNLESITFEGNITSIISTYTFRNCTSCLIYDFSHCTSIPTLAYKNAFTGINANAQIKVPAALEANWKVATNWSTYTSHIVGV